MGLFDRLGRLVRANLNDMVSNAEDPEKILEQAIEDMKEDYVQLRQSVAQAIAAKKRTEQEYNNHNAAVEKWQKRARLALENHNEELAKDALQRKQNSAQSATQLKAQLEVQDKQVESLKNNLRLVENKIAEAQGKKDILKARAKAAKANEQLQSTVSSMNTGSAMAAFERMEEKVLELEARSQAVYEIGGNDLESQFAALESGSDIDAELAAMKAEMLAGSAPPQGALPASETPETQLETNVVDEELEALKREMDQL
ncbi:MAG: PspA/IM30 family protein [Spirulina sp. SIO3F2]|nr:PspA/IM30 family protein [Spirulina sp. SIO3F2]